MNRTRICPHLDDFPTAFHLLLKKAAVYDSSCSPEARVWLIDTDGGYYLKRAPKGSLEAEAIMTRYFHQKGLAAAVLDYRSDAYDWLLTERIVGEDCTHYCYLDDPKRLCETTAGLLRQLHETDYIDCPVSDRNKTYLATVDKNYADGVFDGSFSGHSSAGKAWEIVDKNRHLLKTDVLLHGDYCLPNVMLDNWHFSGFIDLGNGGVGDRHIDLFWGAWTLDFNLKTDRYRDRFFDAYGRDKINMDMLNIIAAAEAFG